MSLLFFYDDDYDGVDFEKSDNLDNSGAAGAVNNDYQDTLNRHPMIDDRHLSRHDGPHDGTDRAQTETNGVDAKVYWIIGSVLFGLVGILVVGIVRSGIELTKNRKYQK